MTMTMTMTMTKMMTTAMALCGALALLSGCAGTADSEGGDGAPAENTASVQQASTVTCSVVSQHTWCQGKIFWVRWQEQCTHTSGETWVQSRVSGGYEASPCLGNGAALEMELLE